MKRMDSNEQHRPLSSDSRTGRRSDTDVDSIYERLCADLVRRWQLGERVPVEAYLRRHPKLENGDGAFELILTEVVLRQECGDVPPLDEYLWRFPQFEVRLQRHFALHTRLAAVRGPTSSTACAVQCSVPSLTVGLPALPGFEIVQQIGRGGMGIVYKAREANLGRFVALKLLRDDHAREPDRLARFLREARTASALNHPGICTVHALCPNEGRPFIVMELIEGVTLRAYISRRPPPHEVSRLISQAALALAAAHAAGVVHRDIKPENIMVREDGQVKVVDFGLARLLPAVSLEGNSPGQHPSPTEPAIAAGTLTYMSPEQTRNEQAGSASDVFSLGIVAYEMMTGCHPFASETILGTYSSIASQVPAPPRRLAPELSNEFNDLMLQMLEKNPRLRPTAAEIGAEFGRETRTKMTLHQREALDAPQRKTVGREVERIALRQAFESADQGNCRILCVCGEPGIGKTTLVEDWLQEFSAGTRVVGVGRGNCSERLAGTGSYLPVLEALDGLLRGEAGSLTARMMRELAPTWYAQVDLTADLPAERSGTATQERMKREFLAFVTQIGRRLPLILFIDDLHWADASTLDLLAWLGRHCAGLRLLVVTTYRPAEMHSGKNLFASVQLELEQHGVCRVLPLVFLTDSDVERYLSLRFPHHRFPRDFAAGLHAKTEGNPLFLAELLNHLCDRGVIASHQEGWTLTQPLPDFQKDLPVSVRSLIRSQFDQLDEADRRLLSVASIQGYEFDAVVAAEVLCRNAADVEERLERLDHVHGLVRLVRELEFPDGTLTLRYRFVHVLYQNSLYSAAPLSRRIQWSAAVAHALLAHHGSHHAVVAGEAALLFEKARDWAKAAECFDLAARYPLRLHAHREAAVLARRGLQMLARLPDTPDRARQEVRLQFALGLALQPSEGFAAPVVVEAYRRARALSHVEIEISSRSPLLWGLWSFYILRGEHSAAREIAQELATLAQGPTNPCDGFDAGRVIEVPRIHGALAFDGPAKATMRKWPNDSDPMPFLARTACGGASEAALVSLAHDHSMGYSLMMLGQPDAAWLHLGRDLPENNQAAYGRDIGIPFRAHGAVVLWLLGFPDQAVHRSHQAAELAEEKMDFYGLSIALFNAAKIHQLRREPEPAAHYAKALLTLAEEQAFPVWFAAGTILAGWAEAQRGHWESGAARIRQGIEAYLANGAAMMHPYFLGLLSEALDAGGQIEPGLEALSRALSIVQETGESYYEAELHRQRGNLLLKLPGTTDRQAEAQACFQKAVEVAHQQKSLSLELRAAVSAVQFEQRHGHNHSVLVQAVNHLRLVCDQFPDAYDSSDWRETTNLCKSR